MGDDCFRRSAIRVGDLPVVLGDVLSIEEDVSDSSESKCAPFPLVPLPLPLMATGSVGRFEASERGALGAMM